MTNNTEWTEWTVRFYLDGETITRVIEAESAVEAAKLAIPHAPDYSTIAMTVVPLTPVLRNALALDPRP